MDLDVPPPLIRKVNTVRPVTPRKNIPLVIDLTNDSDSPRSPSPIIWDLPRTPSPVGWESPKSPSPDREPGLGDLQRLLITVSAKTPMIPISLVGKDKVRVLVKVLVDSGAEVSVISSSLVKWRELLPPNPFNELHSRGPVWIS